nr:CBS domain-containing protein [uncultured Hyphomonas sp.]
MWGADQEKAARLMQRYDLLALPVVDDENHLVGMITYDDLLDVLEDEATEDIYRLGGVPKEQPADVGLDFGHEDPAALAGIESADRPNLFSRVKHL